MQQINTIEQGVQAAFDEKRQKIEHDWKFVPASEGELTDTVIVDGDRIPLFWWRYDNQIFPLEELERNMNSVSCKLNTISTKSVGLDSLMIRHFDIAEWFLKSKVKKLNCYQKGNSAAVLLTMENEKVAMVEIAATLHKDLEEQGRMTIWGRNGMASNRVVSQKDAPQSIYVYHSDGRTETFNDLCRVLYGLDRLQVMKVCAIANILCGKYDVQEAKENIVRYEKYLAFAKLSAKENRPYTVKEN